MIHGLVLHNGKLKGACECHGHDGEEDSDEGHDAIFEWEVGGDVKMSRGWKKSCRGRFGFYLFRWACYKIVTSNSGSADGAHQTERWPLMWSHCDEESDEEGNGHIVVVPAASHY